MSDTPHNAASSWPKRAGAIAINLVIAALLFEVTVRVAVAIAASSGLTVGSALSSFAPHTLMPHTGDSFRDHFVHDAELGWQNLPGRHVRDGVVQTVDSAHRRFSPETQAPAPSIAFLGDSFTFGTDVGDADLFTTRLAEAFPKAQIYNHGVPGYGQDQMLLGWRRWLSEAPPDVVVLGFIAPDSERTMSAFFFNPKPQFVLRDGHLTLTHVPVPTPAQARADSRFRPRSFDLIELAMRAYRGPAVPTEFTPLVSQILQTFIAEVRAAGAVPLVVQYPTGRRDIAAHETFEILCPPTEAACVSLLDAFEPGADLLTQSNHWNAAGHAIIAEALVPHVARSLSMAASSTPEPIAAPRLGLPHAP